MAKLEKLTSLTDSKIQDWLRIIDVSDLEKAMLGVGVDVKNCIFRNMSPRAVKVLQEYLAQDHSPQEVLDINPAIVRLEEKLLTI